jgi:serine/threonine protein kinase
MPISQASPLHDDGLHVLWEDGALALCRRRCTGGTRSTELVVRLAGEHSSSARFGRLSHECELKDDLDEAWAAKPLKLAREQGSSLLLLEDPGGEPLSLLLGRPLEVPNFLRLAIDIAWALKKVHERGLVHKDLKPTHILVNCLDGGVRLTGFGIASRLPRERQSRAPPEALSGTLAYLAPEQTGRMNRSVDARSDLYSLGVPTGRDFPIHPARACTRHSTCLLGSPF